MGEKIGAFSLPFFMIGITINYFYPQIFRIDGSSGPLYWISIFFLLLGVINWAWSVILILIKVPRKELIMTGPVCSCKTSALRRFCFFDYSMGRISFEQLAWNSTWIGIIHCNPDFCAEGGADTFKNLRKRLG